MTATPPGLRLVVMGVAGSGKSTIGEWLAEALGVPFVEGDSLHPAGNVAKMSAGVPLDDSDRWPWLERVAIELAAASPVVLACSALRRSYRDVLREAGDVRFVHLEIDRDEARARLARRRGHFMRAVMVDSQFATLEPPSADESDVLTVSGSEAPEAIGAAVLAWLAT